MTRTPVVSSQIASIGYENGTLEIEFKPFTKKGAEPKPNSVYIYSSVPVETYAAMMAAESKGAFFIKAIKPFPEQFPYKKLK